MMKTFALLLSLAVLTGCASNQVEVEQSDRYAQLEPTQHIKASPVPLPQTPQLKIAEVGGQEVAVLDGDGVNALNAYSDGASSGRVTETTPPSSTTLSASFCAQRLCASDNVM